MTSIYLMLGFLGLARYVERVNEQAEPDTEGVQPLSFETSAISREFTTESWED